MSDLVLAEPDWTARHEAHHARVEAFLAAHPHRGRTGRPHPVWDFLFTYYSLKPRRLRHWHPGYGVVLAGDAARRFLHRPGYTEHPRGVTVGAAHLAVRADTVRFIADLLRATADRPARLNCFGLHEWAMVYRSQTVRHSEVPLRLGVAGTDAVVAALPLRCTHFDAYRFFTEAAAGRNARLSRETQRDDEQPGCLHAAMDLGIPLRCRHGERRKAPDQGGDVPAPVGGQTGRRACGLTPARGSGEALRRPRVAVV